MFTLNCVNTPYDISKKCASTAATQILLQKSSRLNAKTVNPSAV